MRLVVAINDRCTINRDGRRPMVRSTDRCLMRPIVRSLVIPCERAYDQSWHSKPDGTSNRGMQRSIARSIVASCDRSYDKSLLPLLSFVVPNDLGSQVKSFEHDHRPCCDLVSPCDQPRPLRPVVRPFYDVSTIPNCFGRSYVVAWS